MLDGIYALSFVLFSFAALSLRQHFKGKVRIVKAAAVLMLVVSMRAFVGHVHKPTDFPVIDGLLLLAFLSLLAVVAAVVIRHTATADPSGR